MKEQNNVHDEECPSRPSFREAYRRAAEQAELSCADEGERAFLRELCYIIAEVYIMRPDAKVYIAGEVSDAYLVQEIFGELTIEHLRMVHEGLKRQIAPVKNKRAYLRASLYNSVFELEAHYENVASCIMAARGEK